MILGGLGGGRRIRPAVVRKSRRRFFFSFFDWLSMSWTHHVESDHVSERDVACSVFFDEGFVYQLGTTPCRKAEDKGLFGRQSMCFDAFYLHVSSTSTFRSNTPTYE